MDCLDEWNSYTKHQGPNWLLRAGEDLLDAEPVQRGLMMSHFIDQLLEKGVILDHLAGWVLVTEVYGNAMALRELKKVSRLINTKEA